MVIVVAIIVPHSSIPDQPKVSLGLRIQGLSPANPSQVLCLSTLSRDRSPNLTALSPEPRTRQLKSTNQEA